MSSKRKKVYAIDRLMYKVLIIMSKLTFAAVFAAALSILASAHGIAETPAAVKAVEAQIAQQEAEHKEMGEDLSWKERIVNGWDKTTASAVSLYDGIVNKDEREKRKDMLIKDQQQQIADLQNLLIKKVSLDGAQNTRMLMCVEELGKYLEAIPKVQIEDFAPPAEDVSVTNQ